MIKVSLPAGLEEQLEKAAARAGQSVEAYIVAALIQHLEEENEELLAEAAYKEYVSQGKPGISLEDLKKKYNLA